MTDTRDMRRQIVLRELNQGALAGMPSEISEQGADLVLNALDSYDTWSAGKATARLARIAEAHVPETFPGGLVSGLCVECEQRYPCPTRVWATTERDPLATWDPADDDPELPACPASLLPKGEAPAERCVRCGPHSEHVTEWGVRWTDAPDGGEQS
ncbi:hypothetical protein [Streptomyces sp. NPDC051997]|uniref:hypothetical protein n=1 Tax=Streptomyces sp. NPDC051997 TaxID=3155611 RepID=UPI00343EFE4C